MEPLLNNMTRFIMACYTVSYNNYNFYFFLQIYILYLTVFNLLLDLLKGPSISHLRDNCDVTDDIYTTKCTCRISLFVSFCNGNREYRESSMPRIGRKAAGLNLDRVSEVTDLKKRNVYQ